MESSVLTERMIRRNARVGKGMFHVKQKTSHDVSRETFLICNDRGVGYRSLTTLRLGSTKLRK